MARLLETSWGWKTWEVEVTTNTAEITTDVNYLYMGVYNNDDVDDVYMRHTDTNILTYGMPIPIGSYKEIPVKITGKKYVKVETGTASLRIEIGLM